MTEEFSYFEKTPDLSVVEIGIPRQRFAHYQVLDRESGIYGFGTGASAHEAQTKALFEMIERSVFHRFNAGTQKTSSGWAAHTDPLSARRHASFELLERDSSLCSWILRQSPELNSNNEISSNEFISPLMIFEDWGVTRAYGLVIDNRGNSRAFLTCTASSNDEAFLKLTAESERSFLTLKNRSCFEGTPLASHHEAFCNALPEDLAWLYRNGDKRFTNAPQFSFQDFRVPLWNGNVAYVSGATSDQLQTLNWGNLQINWTRINKIKPIDSQINPAPHPFL